jgi:hypothetical protein
MRTLRGVGGRELVFTRRLDRLSAGAMTLDGFEVEVGDGRRLAIEGILGMDFLLGTHAVLDLNALSIDTSR